MRISRVYFEGLLALNSSISLTAETSHYLSKVLRLRVDDKLVLFNAECGEYLARIGRIEKKEVQIELLQQQSSLQHADLDSAIKIHLFLGLSRGDRMDFAIQKSTELGVSEITPVYTDHGEVRLQTDRVQKKLQHWCKIAISACEQSGRLDIPLIHKPRALHELELADESITKLMLDPSGSDKLPAHIDSKSIELLIGPEGGFSSTEIAAAQGQGFKIISLGSRILRTETAPVAALAILQHKYGDM